MLAHIAMQLHGVRELVQQALVNRATRKLLQNCHITVRTIVQPEQHAPAPLELEGGRWQHVGWVEHNHLVEVRLLARGAGVVPVVFPHRHVVAVVAVGAAAPVCKPNISAEKKTATPSRRLSGAAAPVRLLIARAPKQPVVQRVGLDMKGRSVRGRLWKGMLRDGVGAAHERERHEERALDLTRGH